MSAPDAVEVVGLRKRYGPVRAVDGVTFTARLGEVTALLGPNGAGKTTTIEICEGFRRPDDGLVRVLGADPQRDARALKPRVGVMLQAGGVYPGATGREMLRLLAAFARHPLDVDALLERLGLTAAAGTPIRRLSGGQRQRLALALALVGRPELVVLDEPTAGLDPQARRATWELVRQLRVEGVSVLLSTHYLEEAEELADRVVIVDAGRVVADGAPEALTAAGADPTSAGQLRFRARSGLDLAELLAALPTDAAATEEPPGHYRLTGRIDPQFLAAVTAWCAGHGVMPDDLHVGTRSLEDVFLDLTGKALRG